MPIYHFQCVKCQKSSRRLLPQEIPVLCKLCGELLLRDPKPLTTSTKEVLDNGLMVRSIERLVDAEEIVKERSRQDAIENADFYRSGVKE